MNWIAALVFLAAALAAFLAWWDTRPHRFASSTLALFLFIVAVALVFILQFDPVIRVTGD